MTTITKPSDTRSAAEVVAKTMAEAPNPDALFEEAFTELAGLKLAGYTQSSNKETGIVSGLGTIPSQEEGL